MSNLMEYVMKKIWITALGLVFALAINGNASKIKTVQNFFVVDSDDLVIRPLTSGDKKKTWKIEDTGETEKYVQMFHGDTSDAPENAKISQIFLNQRSLLSRPWTILQDLESLERINPEHNHKLYLGVFEKKQANRRSALELVGVVNLSGFEKRGDFLWFEYMFDPHMRGKGYGTQTVQLMTNFLKQNNIIATNSEEIENFPYKGVKAIVDFENKASLAVILAKCQFQISNFSGCFVELVQPPQQDDSIHTELKPKFDTYLKRPPVLALKNVGAPDDEQNDIDEVAEYEKAMEAYEEEKEKTRQNLREESVKKMMALPIDELKERYYRDDVYHIVSALYDYPDLFAVLKGEGKDFIHQKITKVYKEHYRGLKGPVKDPMMLWKRKFLDVLKMFTPPKKAPVKRSAKKTSVKK